MCLPVAVKYRHILLTAANILIECLDQTDILIGHVKILLVINNNPEVLIDHHQSIPRRKTCNEEDYIHGGICKSGTVYSSVCYCQPPVICITGVAARCSNTTMWTSTIDPDGDVRPAVFDIFSRTEKALLYCDDLCFLFARFKMGHLSSPTCQRVTRSSVTVFLSPVPCVFFSLFFHSSSYS